MREVKAARQVDGEPHRRWFTNNRFDLIVWDEAGEILAFELCMSKDGDGSSVTWKKGSGSSQTSIDFGECNPRKNKSPVLAAKKAPPIVALDFLQDTALLDKPITELVYSVLVQREATESVQGAGGRPA